jgi:hypothetical protein
VTVLAVGLLVVAAAFLLNALRACLKMPDRILPELHVLLLMGLLRPIWLGATGAGLLAGRHWARASFFALTALSVVVAAGAFSRPLDSIEARTAAGFLGGIALVAGGGTWYLLGARVRAWFR